MSPARFCWIAAAAALLCAAPQPTPAQIPEQVRQIGGPVPDHLSLSKLLWSTMVAVEHANRTGNFEVLRALGSPGFQQGNDGAALGEAFASIRRQRIDLADSLLVTPLHEFEPGIIEGMLRMRGTFNLRPTAIQFDVLYEWHGAWRLHAIAVMPVPMSQIRNQGR